MVKELEMEQMNIYFSMDTELSEYEAINKGYRVDVYAAIGKDIFNLKVYTLTRLQQDFETECETNGFYSVEPNLVLVRDADKDEIINTIDELYRQRYFESLKPMKAGDISGYTRVR